MVISYTFLLYNPTSLQSETHVLDVTYIPAYWCLARFPYQMMFVSFNGSMTGATTVAGTAYLS